MILDPVELLDILGNENRRRILQLLSFRPFYFNEMAKRLDVGPKAIIDHLLMLERAGLVECYQDQGRRKYFRIVRKTVLEVSVSPNSYGVRAYRSEDVPKTED
ncbi:MAG TPA: helix-turn-helix domain-containing protein, partial [Methanothrix sp.]|nr:helix-turn-helix domain-containing protein [Methanothrix sp.]